MDRFLWIFLILPILSSCLQVPSGLCEDINWDLSFNKTFYYPNIGGECFCDEPLMLDSYWIDSWTADAEAEFWYTPEKYTFHRGEIISAVTFFVQVPPDYLLEGRYDAFYFCGETNAKNYIAYGYREFRPFFVPWWCAIFYDTKLIPERFLPLEIDWTSKLVFNYNSIFCGIPLSGRPDCFTIEK